MEATHPPKRANITNKGPTHIMEIKPAIMLVMTTPKISVSFAKNTEIKPAKIGSIHKAASPMISFKISVKRRLINIPLTIATNLNLLKNNPPCYNNQISF